MAGAHNLEKPISQEHPRRPPRRRRVGRQYQQSLEIFGPVLAPEEANKLPTYGSSGIARFRMHWILEDMLRRTPLVPYLLQLERLAAESASPDRMPLHLGSPSLGSSGEPYRYPPSANVGKGIAP